MKKETHPEFKETIFKDISSGFMIKTKSTMYTKDTIEWEDGKTYPVVNLEISSASHPFYTGKQRVSEAEGRAARFKKKYSRNK